MLTSEQVSKNIHLTKLANKIQLPIVTVAKILTPVQWWDVICNCHKYYKSYFQLLFKWPVFCRLLGLQEPLETLQAGCPCYPLIKVRNVEQRRNTERITLKECRLHK